MIVHDFFSMKNPKGFIQIPILIAIIVGILVLGGIGYFGVKQYQSSQRDKEYAQAEIEKLKQENKFTQERQKELEKKIGIAKETKDSSSLLKKSLLT